MPYRTAAGSRTWWSPAAYASPLVQVDELEYATHPVCRPLVRRNTSEQSSWKVSSSDSRALTEMLPDRLTSRWPDTVTVRRAEARRLPARSSATSRTR